jgi:hypothetical protein
MQYIFYKWADFTVKLEAVPDDEKLVAVVEGLHHTQALDKAADLLGRCDMLSFEIDNEVQIPAYCLDRSFILTDLRKRVPGLMEAIITHRAPTAADHARAFWYGRQLGRQGIGYEELAEDWPEVLTNADVMRGWKCAYDRIGDDEVLAMEAAEAGPSSVVLLTKPEAI